MAYLRPWPIPFLLSPPFLHTIAPFNYSQLLMPTTAADTLILHSAYARPRRPGGERGVGWESRAVAAAAASRQMSGVTVASEARMGVLTTDDRQLLMTVSRYREMVCTAT